MKNLLIKIINKNLIKSYYYIILFFLIIIINNFKLINKNTNNYNTFKDLDLSSSTDFEDFAIVLNDSIEVIFHDYSILSDGFVDLFFYFSSFCVTSSLIKNLR